MKISDIVGKRSMEQDPVPSKGDQEAEKLLRQREDIEKENDMEYIEKDMEEIENPKKGFFPGQQQQQRQQQPMMQQQPTQEQIMQQQARLPTEQLEEELAYEEQQYQQQQQRPVSKLENFKITVFMDGGIALPVIFKSRREELEAVFEDVNEKIKNGDVIIIGNFNIPGNKILYIDLLGR